MKMKRMNFLRGYLTPHWRLLIGVLGLAAINQIASLMDPQVLRWLMDNYLTQFSRWSVQEYVRGILIGVAGFVIVAMISRIAKNFQDYFVNVLTQKIGMEIYQNTINHAFSLQYEVFEDQESGQLLQKLNTAKTSLQNYIASLINIVFVALVGIVFVLFYSFYVDWRIGAMYVLLLPIMAFTTIALSKKIKIAQETISKETAKVSGTITESIRNVGLIKMLGLIDQEMGRLQRSNNEILSLELKKARTVRSLEFIQGTLINGMRVALMGVLGYLVYVGSITIGELLSLYFYSFFLFGQLGMFGMVVRQYQEAKANHELLEDINSLSPMERPAEPIKISDISSIEAKNVSFAYGKEKKKLVLSNISFAITSGQSVAFVGPSGSGKSTLLKLLSGLYQPLEGSILINGYPLEHIDETYLRENLGIVTQDAMLFSGSIRQNLQFVSPNATEEEIFTALSKASLDEFVRTLPLGLDTWIGEGGLKLSGGQKQRLAIARALLRNPQILIFDEATSALDSIIEKEISETIDKIAHDRPDLISIHVAHRLSTVMHCDMIYVLSKGEIIEAGTHAQLLQNDGLYKALWKEQIGE